MKKSTGLTLLLLLLCAAPGSAAEPQRIAVAAEGDEPSAQVSAVAGRSPFFLLFDEKGAFISALANPYQNARGGAGPQAALFLAEKEVTVAVAGDFGPKMVDVMRSRGIRPLEFMGTAADAVKHALRP
ncbi:NifB/NifX family molybdenum-iron cluster-binding protein [Trichloromonas sp.]|uniref:NifB/NifX family molybdenum-iron cluster-binding protein n=1 Tax=Trichloromonas sp. TaxID=3069249 RepID=UPI002A4376E7|nr:NifB/NifX family molybdenum-iron cluster-binding protein [Trichloromonas sp.]